jgi:hypothetical protein
MKNQILDNQTAKRKYTPPDITVIKIDNEISLVMMSGASPDNDPGGHRQSKPDNKPDKPSGSPFQNPFH